jgi:hypothetical protein
VRYTIVTRWGRVMTRSVVPIIMFTNEGSPEEVRLQTFMNNFLQQLRIFS